MDSIENLVTVHRNTLKKRTTFILVKSCLPNFGQKVSGVGCEDTR